ncbi:hypothetical protein QJS04_geneDACA015824 [Acorus gramineus]|uniref:Uncharacterized protein n=1 Tax=Acorus gramineus TaxID=55184 RepID=A0AAV9BRG9_ACOGR|nr:hypothetical protein QJS04_geneDACA015824 [Acorus gramineus]
MEDVNGTIVFTTVDRPFYGFDIFSVEVPPTLDAVNKWTEKRLTDGRSVNFNGHFVDESRTLAYVSERTGAPRVYLNRLVRPEPEPLPTPSEALFTDRPTVKDGKLYHVSTHEPPEQLFKSWSAVYSTRIDSGETTRLTPVGEVDFSPAVSRSGKLVAVASYGSRPWSGDFHELSTEIVVFPASDPSRRVSVCGRGGWPSWAGDSTIFFHCVADDGWWSVFCLDLTEDLVVSGDGPRRITPPGIHAFTPAASHDGRRIAVATRRPGSEFRQIEIFDIETEAFVEVTKRINPKFNHYNPFFSPESGHIGYHRFRGESATGDLTIPYLEPVKSPIAGLRMLRLNGSFPSFTRDGDLIACNHNFDPINGGVYVIRSNGSKRWRLLKNRIAFYTSYSPTERGVIYTSVGPIFEAPKTTVQIARITFDPTDLKDGQEEVQAEVKILTSESSGNNAFPSCSPDGKWLVFRSGRSGHKNLYIIDAVNGESDGGGSGIRRLTYGECIDTMPNWSPDGSLIGFSSNRHNPANPGIFGIYVINPDGTGLRRVHVAGPEEADLERINHVCFSPDSKWLVFTANLGSVSAEPVSLPNHFQPYGDLFVVRLDGTGLRRITCNAYENGTPTWHTVIGEPDIGSLSLGDDADEVGEKLRGQFQEPLWFTCDI